MKSIIYILIPLLLTSCAHTFMRGTVAKKINSKKAIICLGSDEVKIGDTIKFQESVCSWTPTHSITMHEKVTSGLYSEQTGYGSSNCELIHLGRGTVVEIINDHFSIVKTKGDFQFKKSTQVEIVR